MGPVLKSKLVAAGMESPFPIQEAAFTPITRGRNVVIGSATGSGKTLAFLLPILATSQRTTPSRVLVVTASRELTHQLRRSADLLWPPQSPDGQGSAADDTEEPSSVVHIVDEGGMEADGEEAGSGGSRADETASGHAELVKIGAAPILVGTPYALCRLMSAANRALQSHSGASGGEDDARARALAIQLRENLKVVIIDEADQLLESANAAQQVVWRKKVSDEQGKPLSARQRDHLKRRAGGPSATEMLLADLPVALSNMQLVCASATVGRSLRRQLQGLLNAPSIEKAAELVSASDRDAKQVGVRRAALMPQSLLHRYRLVTVQAAAEVAAEVADAENVANDDDEDVAADNGDAAITEQVAEPAASKRRDATLLTALTDAMESVAPAPTIIFCGRTGVRRVTEALRAAGMDDVRPMQELSSASAAGVSEEATEEDTKTGSCGEPTGGAGVSKWASTPIYVGSERWGRGLDLEVDYVFLLNPPASSASYAHLAGRTGRKGRKGTAVTLLTHQQVPRLVGFAEGLGLSFEALESE